ncbi:hypothetical protein KJ682_02240 [bacterium]|nr:hypothetical protein [bacterium]
MTPDCFGPEDLDSLVDGTASQALQGHLEACRECRLLLAEYRSFLAAEPTAGADPAAADARLDRLWDRVPAPSWRVVRPRRTFFSGPAWRPTLAAACIAAALLLVLIPRVDGPGDGPSGVMRGTDPAGTGFLLDTLETLPSGRIRVTWSAFAGADGYRVEVLDQELTVVHRQDAAEGELEAQVVPDSLPEGAGPFFVRSLALAAGSELERTPLRELPGSP